MKRILEWFYSINTMMVLMVINLLVFLGIVLVFLILKFVSPSLYLYTPFLFLAAWACYLIIRKFL
jgi:hypothetical protein